MLNVEQALKNNILIFAMCAIMAFGFACVCGLAAKAEAILIAVVVALAAISTAGAGMWKWDQIKDQIKMLKENKSYVDDDQESE